MSLRDIALALFVMLIWGGNVVAIKLAIIEAAPLTALAIRFGLTGLVFLPFIKPIDRATFFKLLQVAILMGVLHQGLLFMAMEWLPAGVTSILLQSQVIFAALIGWLVFNEKTGWRTWAGIALGIVGILIMFGADHDAGDGFVLGFALIVGSTLTLAFAYMRMKQLSAINPATFLCAINGLAFPFVLASSFVIDAGGWAELPAADPVMLSGVMLYQIFIVGLSHIIWQGLLSRNPMSLVTPFTLLLPLFGVGMAVLLLEESLTMRMLAGGIVTMLGVGIIILRNAKKGRPLPRTPAQN